MDVVVDDVSQVFGGPNGVVALEHFSHRFRSRRFACILGPSGCGKSTLIQIIGGLEPATSGRVHIQHPDKKASPLGADSVMVWQNLNLFPWPSATGARARSSPRSACAASRTTCPASCPAACASASRSPAR